MQRKEEIEDERLRRRLTGHGKAVCKGLRFRFGDGGRGGADVRMVDVFYDDGSFYIVTHETPPKPGRSRKTPP